LVKFVVGRTKGLLKHDLLLYRVNLMIIESEPLTLIAVEHERIVVAVFGASLMD